MKINQVARPVKANSREVQVLQLLKRANLDKLDGLSISPAGVVSAKEFVTIDDSFNGWEIINPNGALRVQFGSVGGFDIDGLRLGLKSFKGFPRVVEGPPTGTWAMSVSTQRSIGPTNFENFTPRILNGGLDLTTAGSISSLSGIANHVKEIHGVLALDEDAIISSILGVLMIKGLRMITTGFTGRSNFDQAQDIVNRHLAKGRDILACQEELIDNDLEEFAQL